MKIRFRNIFFGILIISISMFLFGCEKAVNSESTKYLDSYFDKKNHDLYSLSEMFQLEEKRADRKKLMLSKGIDSGKITKLLEKEEKTDDKLVSLMQLDYTVDEVTQEDNKLVFKIKLKYMDIKRYNEKMAVINDEANKLLSGDSVSGEQYYKVMNKLIGKINKALKAKSQKLDVVFVKTSNGYKIDTKSDEQVNEIITHG